MIPSGTITLLGWLKRQLCAESDLYQIFGFLKSCRTFLVISGPTAQSPEPGGHPVLYQQHPHALIHGTLLRLAIQLQFVKHAAAQRLLELCPV